MAKTVMLEWADDKMIPEPNDKLIAELDKEFEYKEARAERLTKIAKADKGAFIKLFQNALEKVEAQEYERYVQEIEYIYKETKDKGFAEHRRNLKLSTDGFSLYLKLKFRDKGYITAAERAGMSAEAINTLIRQRAEKVYTPVLPPLAKQPKRNVLLNSTLVNKLCQEPWINDGAKDMEVMDDITTYVMAVYEENKDIAPFNLTAFERTVMDAVCSIWKQATEVENMDVVILTPSLIYKAMPGYTGKMSAVMRANIVKAIDKMSAIRMEIDATDEMLRRKKIEDGEAFSIKQNMLYTEGATYKQRNGEVLDVWRLMAKPCIYTYSDKIDQLFCVKQNVVQIQVVDSQTHQPNGDPLKMGEKKRVALSYVLRRIEVMRNKYKLAGKLVNQKRFKEDKTKKWTALDIMQAPATVGGLHTSDLILYNSIFEYAETDTTHRTTVKREKDFWRSVFAYWKAIGHIDGFTEEKEGRTTRGIRLLFN